jgi:hypothetical protein
LRGLAKTILPPFKARVAKRREIAIDLNAATRKLKASDIIDNNVLYHMLAVIIFGHVIAS